MRRVPLTVAADLDELDRLLGAEAAPVVLVCDADNTLVRQGAGLEEFQREVTGAVARLADHPAVAGVTVLTNGPDRGVPGVIHRGNKPWTTRRRLGLPRRGHPIWVVGDQVLTDGVLAWRLGATFVHLVLDAQQEDRRQSTMRRIGRVVHRSLFTT